MSEQSSHRDPLEELAESFMDRYRHGERPSLSEYTDKFPEQADRIKKLFPTLVMMETLASGDGDDAAHCSGQDLELDRLGDYRLLREVGRGGMGVVYEAEQESLGRRVALKVLPIYGLLDSNYLKRFQREARAAARLHHTHIVPVFDVGQHEGVHYFAMQFIHGQGLNEVLTELITIRNGSEYEANSKATGRIVNSIGDGPAISKRRVDNTKPNSTSAPPPSGSSGWSNSSRSDMNYFRSIAKIGAQVAAALAHAHEQGIWHRDVKPSNLMLDTEGKAWVMDFGLAKTDAKEDLTHTGDLVGTLRYMAPERFQGWSDPRSDIYGLGLTLYELLTLRHVFDESDRAKLVHRITNEELIRPRKIDHNIPVDLETIVLKATAKEPGMRYPSAAEFSEDLLRFVKGEPIEARRTSLSERMRMWSRRNPLAATLTAAIAFLLVTVTIGSTVAAIWLRSERNRAVNNLERATSAEQAATESAIAAGDAEARERAARVEAQHSLYEARLAQARASRWSGRMGRRFEGLEALTEAAQLARQLQLGEKALFELRNEAIASLALVDLRIDKRWPLDGPQITQAVAYDANLQRYATLETNGSIVVRDIQNNSQLAKIPSSYNLAGIAPWIRFSPDGCLLAVKGQFESGRKVVVYELSSGEVVFEHPAGGEYNNVDFSSDSRFLAFATEHNEVHVHDLLEDVAVVPIVCPQLVRHMVFGPQGRYLAVEQYSRRNSPGKVLVIDWRSRKFVHSLEHPLPVGQPTWGPNAALLATPCFDRNVYIWDLATGRPLEICKGHQGGVFHATMNSANLLVSTGGEVTSRFWDPRTGNQLLHADYPFGRFSRDGRWLSASEMAPDQLNTRRPVIRFEVALPRILQTLVGHGDNSHVISVSFSPDGRMLASTGSDGFRAWDVDRARQLATIPGSPWLNHSALFSPRGRHMVVSGAEVTLWPINTESFETDQVVKIGPPQLINTADRENVRWKTAFIGKRNRIVSAAPGKGLFLVDLENSKQQKVTRNLADARMIAPSPDGNWMALLSENGTTIRVADGKTGDVVKELSAPRGAVMQFSPDGKWLVGGLDNGLFVFWHVDTWNESHRIVLDSTGHSQIAFTNDMRLMAITGAYHVSLIDPANGKEIARLNSPNRELLAQPYPEAVSGITFSEDGSMLAVGSDNGPIQLWNLQLIRKELADVGLDWDHPNIPERRNQSSSNEIKIGTANLPPALRVEIVGLELLDEVARLLKLNKSIDPDANDVGSLWNRVKTNRALKRFEDMIDDTTRMIELEPENNAGYFWRGRALMMLGQHEQAIRDFRQSLEIKSLDVWPNRHLAWLYLVAPDGVGDFDKALKYGTFPRICQTGCFLVALC